MLGKQDLAVNTLCTVYSVLPSSWESSSHCVMSHCPRGRPGLSWATWSFSVIFQNELGSKVSLSLVVASPRCEIRLDSSWSPGRDNEADSRRETQTERSRAVFQCHLPLFEKPSRETTLSQTDCSKQDTRGFQIIPLLPKPV